MFVTHDSKCTCCLYTVLVHIAHVISQVQTYSRNMQKFSLRSSCNFWLQEQEPYHPIKLQDFFKFCALIGSHGWRSCNQKLHELGKIDSWAGFHVSSYPGHVGEERRFSPPMWPGYEASFERVASETNDMSPHPRGWSGKEGKEEGRKGGRKLHMVS